MFDFDSFNRTIYSATCVFNGTPNLFKHSCKVSIFTCPKVVSARFFNNESSINLFLRHTFMSAILADVIAGANEVTVTLTRLVLVLVESFGSPPLLTYSKRLTSIAGSSGLTTATWVTIALRLIENIEVGSQNALIFPDSAVDLASIEFFAFLSIILKSLRLKNKLFFTLLLFTSTSVGLKHNCNSLPSLPSSKTCPTGVPAKFSDSFVLKFFSR